MNFLIFLTVIVALTVSVARASKILNDLWSFQLMTRSVPSIEVNYCYSKVDESDAVSTVLVAIDSIFSGFEPQGQGGICQRC